VAFIDYAQREINCKIVYYGPGLAGKTTNIHYVYSKTDPAYRTKLLSVATETERTLSFDFRPQSLGEVRGFHCRFHLYTVPGPVFYDPSRVQILKGADGVVFVADSQEARDVANVESLEELESNLALHGQSLGCMPLVLQYNKRDAPNILSVADLDAMLNPAGRPRFEAVASTGSGVFDTLKAVAKQVIAELTRA
jgi:signal recognition particle receptor subunit beta